MKIKYIAIMVFLMIFVIGGTAAAEKIRFGVAWVKKSGMTSRVAKGFEEEITEIAPNIKIEYQKELSSMDELADVIKRFQKEKDGMLVMRSPGVKYIVENPPSIPTFIGGCNNPALLGAVKNMDSPEGNITGVTYYLPRDTQIKVFKSILPKMDSLLLLVEKGHPSSLIDRTETREVCSKMNIQYNEKSCSSRQDIITTINSFKAKVSAIVLGTQVLIIDNTCNIVETSGKTPVLSYSSEPVKDGALCGFAADDVKLGRMLATSVADVLMRGKSFKEVPVKVDPDPKFYLNIKVAQRLGIEIPLEVLELATILE